MKKICFVTATPFTVRAFLRDFIVHLARHHQVTVVSAFTENDLMDDWLPEVRLKVINIPRKVDPIADLGALLSVYRFLRKEQFDLVHSVTPKAGLLAMLAARVARVPRRIHSFTGQVWATKQGFWRFILKAADRFVANNATHVLADSHSQRQFLETQGVLSGKKAAVMGHGSISGVDLSRFRPDPAARLEIRRTLGVPESAFLLLFVGRINRDKGVLDLTTAFSRLAATRADVWLAMVGPDEENLVTRCEEQCGDYAERFRTIAHTSAPEKYMVAADVLVLPSYREGFGSVIIEAAACGIPAVASRIYGISDAVVDGETGLLHPSGDVAALHAALERLYEDRGLCRQMGESAHRRAAAEFSMELITASLLRYYEEVLQQADDAQTPRA